MEIGVWGLTAAPRHAKTDRQAFITADNTAVFGIAAYGPPALPSLQPSAEFEGCTDMRWEYIAPSMNGEGLHVTYKWLKEWVMGKVSAVRLTCQDKAQNVEVTYD